MSAFIIVLGIIATIVLTVILCIKVLPAKYDGTFSNKYLQRIHDYFNFKKLYLESVLKVLFIFLSIASVVVSLLQATIGNIINVIQMADYGFVSFSYILRSFISNFFIGVLAAVLVPIALRLVYEGILMFILLVKNVIDINNKMKVSESKDTPNE